MARKPKAKPQTPLPQEAAKSFDDDADEGETLDDEVSVVDSEEMVPGSKSRDWRDVERYREMRELRRLVGDDIEMDDERDRRR